MKPIFFKTPSELRKWFRAEHDKSKEVWIGFYKKESGLVAVTYAEALDQALCFGWIDGIRKKFDSVSYTNRFTPRRPKSNWSKINVSHAKRLIKAGLMMSSGLQEVARAKADGRWKNALKGRYPLTYGHKRGGRNNCLLPLMDSRRHVH